MLAIRLDTEGFRDDFADHWTDIDTCLNRTIGLDLNGREVHKGRHSHSRAERLRAAAQRRSTAAAAAKKHPPKHTYSSAVHQAAAARAAELKSGKSGGKSGGSGGGKTGAGARAGVIPHTDLCHACGDT